MKPKCKLWYSSQIVLAVCFLTSSALAWAAPTPDYITLKAWELWMAAHLCTVFVGSIISVFFADTPTDVAKPISPNVAFIAGLFVGCVAIAGHSAFTELSGFTLVSVACISSAGSSLIVFMRKAGEKQFSKLFGSDQ